MRHVLLRTRVLVATPSRPSQLLTGSATPLHRYPTIHRYPRTQHCHNLVHEDYEMMRSYNVTHSAGSRTASTALAQQSQPALLETNRVIYDNYDDPVYDRAYAKPSVKMPSLSTVASFATTEGLVSKLAGTF